MIISQVASLPYCTLSAPCHTLPHTLIVPWRYPKRAGVTKVRISYLIPSNLHVGRRTFLDDRVGESKQLGIGPGNLIDRIFEYLAVFTLLSDTIYLGYIHSRPLVSLFTGIIRTIKPWFYQCFCFCMTKETDVF